MRKHQNEAGVKSIEVNVVEETQSTNTKFVVNSRNSSEAQKRQELRESYWNCPRYRFKFQQRK